MAEPSLSYLKKGGKKVSAVSAWSLTHHIWTDSLNCRTQPYVRLSAFSTTLRSTSPRSTCPVGTIRVQKPRCCFCNVCVSLQCNPTGFPDLCFSSLDTATYFPKSCRSVACCQAAHKRELLSSRSLARSLHIFFQLF